VEVLTPKMRMEHTSSFLSHMDKRETGGRVPRSPGAGLTGTVIPKHGWAETRERQGVFPTTKSDAICMRSTLHSSHNEALEHLTKTSAGRIENGAYVHSVWPSEAKHRSRTPIREVLSLDELRLSQLITTTLSLTRTHNSEGDL